MYFYVTFTPEKILGVAAGDWGSCLLRCSSLGVGVGRRGHVLVVVFMQRGVGLGEQACHAGKILESYHHLTDTEQH